MPGIVESIECGDGWLVVHPSNDLSGYIKDPIEIQVKRVDFRKIPSNILALPLILNVAPILWRLGGKWTDRHVDAELMRSLDYSRRAMSKLFPQYKFSGSIDSSGRVEYNEQPSGCALLFSGGLDSSFSFFEIPHAEKLLLTIHGPDADIADQRDRWRVIEESAGILVDKFGGEYLRVVSNFTKIFSTDVLELFPDLPAGYWSAIQHGLGFSGVAAPVMFARGKGSLIIGASYTVGSNRSWGSHPFLEGSLKWSGGNVLHHGYTQNRIEKVECLSKSIAQHGVSPKLIVCATANRTSKNCLRCSKCLRTLANILVAKCDPKIFGFEVGQEEAFDLLKKNVPASLKITYNEIHFWDNIKFEMSQCAPYDNMPEFEEWLASLKVELPITAKIRERIRKLIPYKTREAINSIIGRRSGKRK